MSSAACCNPGLSYFDDGVKPAGSIQEMKTPNGNVEVYSTGSGNKYLVILPDVFGHRWANTHRYADSLASAAGIRVLVLRILKSGPIPADFDPSKFGEWLAANPFDYAAEQANELVKALSADKETQSIALLGICYGAKPEVNILLNSEYKLVKGGVFNHPSFITPEEANQVQTDKSFFFNCPADDHIFPTPLRTEWKKILEERKIKSEFRVVEGVAHGFTTRPSNETETAEALKAREATITFLKSIL